MEKITQDQAREKKAAILDSEVFQFIGAVGIGLGHSDESGFNIQVRTPQQPTPEHQEAIESMASPVAVHFVMSGTVQAY